MEARQPPPPNTDFRGNRTRQSSGVDSVAARRPNIGTGLFAMAKTSKRHSQNTRNELGAILRRLPMLGTTTKRLRHIPTPRMTPCVTRNARFSPSSGIAIITKLSNDPHHVSFQYGAPGEALMPTQVMAAASEAFWRDKSNYTYLQYGPTLGDSEYRRHLAEFLSLRYADTVREERLALTGGATASFSNIITLFTTKKTRILVEDPTYFLALKSRIPFSGLMPINQVLQDHGFDPSKFLSIPTDEDGLDVAKLEQMLDANKNTGFDSTDSSKYLFLLYMVPTYSNPTGRSTSLKRRNQLIQLARKHNVLIVCDDVYQLLPLAPSAVPPARLVSLDTAGSTASESSFRGHVISNNSFSKIMAPGLRLGWIETHPSLLAHISRSGIMNSGGSPNHIVSGIITTALKQGGVAAHLDFLQREYAVRLDAMCDALQAGLPVGVSFVKPEGGFFIWLELPAGHDAFEILHAMQTGGLYQGKKLLARVKMSFAPGRLFTSSSDKGGRFSNCLRLTFAFYPKEQLLVGVQGLCALLKEALA
ncbi:pyridoxal phosphate-dependent transferase [Chytriomyces cf. hyalinus JEL632]|nr:pyridoxal phosphate-dependent transferase [Chytriomyces cf. hyalinus JEL632]